MTLETILQYWHIAPVRWSVYMAAVLYVLYVYVMRLKRIRDNGGLSLAQKVIGYPVAVVAVILDWVFNLTVGTVLYHELPHYPTELFTQRLQRALDNPGEYAGYRLALAHWLKPILNRHDKDHLE